MTRRGLAAALLAALAIACSGGESSIPTGPSPSTGSPSGSGSSGGGSGGTTTSCLPAAPGNLRVTTTGSTRVFTWDAVGNVQDYFIQISTTTGTTDLVNTNTTQTTYTWTGASAGNYWARASARNACGSGPNSNQIFFN